MTRIVAIALAAAGMLAATPALAHACEDDAPASWRIQRERGWEWRRLERARDRFYAHWNGPVPGCPRRVGRQGIRHVCLGIGGIVDHEVAQGTLRRRARRPGCAVCLRPVCK